MSCWNLDYLDLEWNHFNDLISVTYYQHANSRLYCLVIIIRFSLYSSTDKCGMHFVSHAYDKCCFQVLIWNVIATLFSTRYMDNKILLLLPLHIFALNKPSFIVIMLRWIAFLRASHDSVRVTKKVRQKNKIIEICFWIANYTPSTQQ